MFIDLESMGTPGAGIPDAPVDGKQYGRQDKTWTEIQPGIADTAADGNTYVRSNGEWKDASTIYTFYVPTFAIDAQTGQGKVAYPLSEEQTQHNFTALTQDLRDFSRPGQKNMVTFINPPLGHGGDGGRVEPLSYTAGANIVELSLLQTSFGGMKFYFEVQCNPGGWIVKKAEKIATEQYVDGIVGTINNELNLI